MKRRPRIDMATCADFAGAPVLQNSEVPLASWEVGIRQANWVPLPPDVKTSKVGEVYLARHADGSIKVGYSRYAAYRIQELKLRPLLLILSCTMANERILHGWFAAERVSGEYFRGPTIEAFIEAAKKRSRSTARDWRGVSGSFAIREREWAQRLRREARRNQKASAA